jgi:hypothetical protein
MGCCSELDGQIAWGCGIINAHAEALFGQLRPNPFKVSNHNFGIWLTSQLPRFAAQRYSIPISSVFCHFRRSGFRGGCMETLFIFKVSASWRWSLSWLLLSFLECICSDLIKGIIGEGGNVLVFWMFVRRAAVVGSLVIDRHIYNECLNHRSFFTDN